MLGRGPIIGLFRVGDFGPHPFGQPVVDCFELIPLRALSAAVHGRWDEARAAFVAAVPLYRQREENLEAAMAQLAAATFLGDRYPDMAAAGTEAEAWFAERGAEAVPERMRAAFRGTPAPASGGSSTSKRAVPVDAEQRA